MGLKPHWLVDPCWPCYCKPTEPSRWLPSRRPSALTRRAKQKSTYPSSQIVSAELVLDLDLAVALVKPCLDIRLFGGKVPKCWGGFIHSSSTRSSTVKLLSHRVNLPPAGK
ncbi:hypothetical protein PGT21_014032 [Puccinia graminis f. sp. tritici]|uniref:Uncharacterized protein n=1 Tax=Puccinia graminis f. sp. tritici TaxID=56615 RepID=A0A5B0R1X3_PUCGR|nr:hypothetical protein PGT21_014032 [Puccinia graminis f. sp. tritici]